MGTTMLKHPNIVGGSGVNIGVEGLTFDFNGFVSNPDIPGKDMTSSFNTLLSETDFVGFANPKHVIQGMVKSGLNTDDNGSVWANVGMLASYCKIGSPVTFFDDQFILNPAGSTQVIPLGFKIQRNVKSAESQLGSQGPVMKYSMTLIETKEWS